MKRLQFKQKTRAICLKNQRPHGSILYFESTFNFLACVGHTDQLGRTFKFIQEKRKGK